MLIKYLLIIFSLLSLISCDDTKTNGTSLAPPSNRVYLKVANNSASDIRYQRDTIHCTQKLNFDSSQFEEWSPVCEIFENDYFRVDYGEKYWGTNIAPVSSATLKPSESATSYGHLGNAIKTGGLDASFLSFIITVKIDNVSKKIVGFNEELYRKLFYDKPDEFFNDVISYGTFFGATLNEAIPTDFKYNTCAVGAHTALTDYANFSLTARYYLDISIKSIDDIKVSLDKSKSKIGNSGYVNDTNECKFYVDEDILDKEEAQRSIFPISEEDYANIPKDLTGRVYMITDPDKSYGVLRYGSDPE